MSTPPALKLRPKAEIRPTTALRAMLDAEAYWPREVLEHPYVFLETTTGPLLFLTGPDLVEAAVRSDVRDLPRSRLQQRFAGNGTGRENVITDTGVRSTAHRKALAPLFRAQKLPDYFPFILATIQKVTEPWFEAADQEQAIDVTQASVCATFGVVWQIMFGEAGRPVPPPAVFEMARTLFEAGASGRLSATSAAIHRAAETSLLLRPSNPLAEETPFRRTLPADFPLTQQEVEDNARFLLTAGHESTALTITWALLMLALHPALQSAAAEEVRQQAGSGPLDIAALRRMALLGRILDETMRLYPAAIVVNREAPNTMELAGLAVPGGTQIAICFYGLHRHRSCWDRPDEFDPDRFLPAQVRSRHPAAFMPFSAGHHSCLGAHLAWTEAMLMLATTLRDLELVVEEGGVKPYANYTLRPDRPVLLRFARRG
ncbi:cytochrome P450 [Radicibacter daui]|uniref:cytochrome P450 n=1 Tax=Radicibacter daui TaxID=3064829 RepID=UPI004046EAAC